MAEVIRINDGQKRLAEQSRVPQQLDATGNRRWFDESHNRRALLRMFLCGSSYRSVGRKHPGREEGLARDLRAAVMGAERDPRRAA
jgi:hypothetical protein